MSGSTDPSRDALFLRLALAAYCVPYLAHLAFIFHKAGPNIPVGLIALDVSFLAAVAIALRGHAVALWALMVLAGITAMGCGLIPVVLHSHERTPSLFLFVGVSIASVAAFFACGVHYLRRMKIRPPWHCPTCGYDLRGTPSGKPCPECGAKREAKA